MENPIYKILTTLAIPFKMILSNIPVAAVHQLQYFKAAYCYRVAAVFFRNAQKYAKFPILFAHLSSLYKGTSLSMDQRKLLVIKV